MQRLFATANNTELQFLFTDVDMVECSLHNDFPAIQLSCSAGAIFDARKRMSFAEAAMNVAANGGNVAGQTVLTFNKAVARSDSSLRAD